MEEPFEELVVGDARQGEVAPEDLQCRPRVHRGVDVVERPLVGGELAGRVHVPLAAQQQELFLGEVRVDRGERHAVERQVPRRVPGVLPGVGHRDHVGVAEVRPRAVADRPPPWRRGRHRRVAVQPVLDVVAVVLLGPDQTRDGASVDHGVLGVAPVLEDRRVPGVGLGRPPRDQRVARSGVGRGVGGLIRQPQVHDAGLTGLEREAVPRGGLAALAGGVDRRRAQDHVVADAVLGPRRERCGSVELGRVGLVLAEQPVRVARGREVEARQLQMLDRHAVRAGLSQPRPGVARVAPPGPGVAEPQRRQDVQRGRLRPVVRRRDADDEVVRGPLGVGHVDVGETVVVEHAGVEQLELGLVTGAAPGLHAQLLVGVTRVRVAVAPDEQAVRRCGVQRPPVLFRVLAVVALAVGDAVEALLQDRVTLVPQGHREAQVLPAVAEPREPVLAPAVGAGVGVLEREAPPSVTVGAVVLAHGAPLPQRQVGAPAPPVRRASTFLGQPRTLGLGLIRAPPRPPRRCRPVVAPPGPHRHGRASCQTATPRLTLRLGK